jgi:hypothetical protein
MGFCAAALDGDFKYNRDFLILLLNRRHMGRDCPLHDGNCNQRTLFCSTKHLQNESNSNHPVSVVGCDTAEVHEGQCLCAPLRICNVLICLQHGMDAGLTTLFTLNTSTLNGKCGALPLEGMEDWK